LLLLLFFCTVSGAAFALGAVATAATGLFFVVLFFGVIFFAIFVFWSVFVFSWQEVGEVLLLFWMEFIELHQVLIGIFVVAKLESLLVEDFRYCILFAHCGCRCHIVVDALFELWISGLDLREHFDGITIVSRFVECHGNIVVALR